MRRVLALSLLCVAVVLGMCPGAVSASYVPKQVTFADSVRVDGRDVPLGTVVIPWVEGVAPEIYEQWQTVTRPINGKSGYACRVPEDNPHTDVKDGAYEGDVVRFYIVLGDVRLTADQTPIYSLAAISPGGIYMQHLTASYLPKPVLQRPADGEKLQAISVTFDWLDVIAPPGVTPTYVLEVDQDPLFGSVALRKTGLVESEWTESLPLAEGAGVYYWRVKAVDGVAWESAWSDVWSFTAPDFGYKHLMLGWNLVTYKGDTLPTGVALESLGDNLVVVWSWSNDEGRWYGYAPDGGFANDLLEMKQYEPYWIYVNAAVVVQYIVDP